MKQLLHESIVFANKAHKGQLRKGTDIDYISHPMEVMQILTAMRADDDLIIAGVLHDTVEDTPVTVEELEEKFGNDIAALVAHHSEDKFLSWIERKTATIDHLEKADRHTKMLVLADKLSNLRSMYSTYQEIGDALWERFNAPKEKQCWYYTEIIKALWDISGFEDIEPFYEEMSNLIKDIFVEYRIDQEAEVLYMTSAVESYFLTKKFPLWKITNEEPSSVFTDVIPREEAQVIEKNWMLTFWECCEADIEDFSCVLFEDESKKVTFNLVGGKITLEGVDVGLGCNIITGGNEYNYSAELDDDDTYTFVCKFRAKYGTDEHLETLLLDKFGEQDAFTKFLEFCKVSGVKYSFDSN